MTEVVLRFSDYEIDTIDEHQAVLGSKGRVWWGWWKKRHEEFQHDTLHGLQRLIQDRGRPQLGLVDRATTRFFVASCSDIRFEPDGTPVATPELDCTPAYYRERQFPAWFCMSALRQVSASQWRQQFGPMPAGDETLFSEAHADGIPAPQRAMSDGYGILHISDLHFGSDFGFPQGNSGRVVATKRLEDILASGGTEKPAVLVISGDLTTRGEHDGFMNARSFITKLLDKLDLDVSSLVVVPGNHDILIEDLTPTRDYSIEQGYRDFLALVYGSQTNLERVQWIQDAAGVDYVFSLVNSSRPRTQAAMDYGYVGTDRSEPVLRTAQSVREKSTGRVVSSLVLHHHVLPAPMLENPEKARPVSLTLDAGELVTLCQRYGVDMILHGHQHLPFIGYAGRVAECGDLAEMTPQVPWPPLWVLGSGSTGASVNRLGDEMRYNSFNRYTVRDNTLTVTVNEFSPTLSPRHRWDPIDLALRTPHHAR